MTLDHAKLSFLDRHFRAPMRIMRKEGWREVIAPSDPKECNCCGFRGAFPAHGFGAVQCPACKSSNRHRMLIWYFQNEIPAQLNAETRFLHLAPERSLGAVLQQLPMRYETADIEAKGVDYHFDLQSFDKAIGPFDIIMANHILEHIPDDRAALRTILRLLKPGGLAIITVPMTQDGEKTDEDVNASAEERRRRFGQAGHVRLYGRDLVARLGEAGFAASIWQPPSDAPIARYAMGGEIMFLGRKPT